MFYALDPDRDERYESVADFAEEADKFLGDPISGKSQLAAIVEDALELADEPDDAYDEASLELEGATASAGAFGFFKSLFNRDKLPSKAPELPSAQNAMPLDYPNEDDLSGNEEGLSPQAAPKSERTARKPLRDKVSAPVRGFLSRAFAAAVSAGVALFAATNITPLEAFGSGQFAVVAAIAIANAVVPAIVLLIALAAWWYFIARDSAGASNVALAAPILGAVGGAPVVPLLAGAALRPVQAVATTAFSAVIALALGSLGSQSLLGWDAMSHWLMGDLNASALFGSLVTKSSTWLIVGCSLVASFAQALLSMQRKRWMDIVGLVLAVALMGMALVVVFGPTLQAIVPLAAGFAALLAVMV